MIQLKIFVSIYFLVFLSFETFAQIAMVNGRVMRVEDLKNSLQTLSNSQRKVIESNQSYKVKYVNHLINNELMAAEAEKIGLDKTASFKNKLEAAKRDLLAQEYLMSRLAEATGDQALRKYFYSHRDKFSNLEVRVAHILFKTDDKLKAKQVLKDALSGTGFDVLAKKHSIGPSASKGGDLGFVGKGMLVPELETVAFSAAKGKVYPRLLHSSFGWHILKVIERKGKDKAAFAEKREMVRGLRKEEVKNELVLGLRKKAGVRVFDEVLRSANL
tara:strand:+ start:881 stop:1699 length:819 start_codon:yes stop_codon:yes gene_type:complete